MKSTRVILRSIVIFLALPCTALAAVQITEVMYDLEGADGGFEWIEITNTGSAAVDVSAWRLFEGNVNHKLKLFKGASAVLIPGASAILADKPENFSSHWPDVTHIFDSAFSLSNTGETLALKNGTVTMDQISYTAELGAKGDGGSLHRSDATFVPALPTPGVFPGELLTIPVKQVEASAPSSKSAGKKVTETESVPISDSSQLATPREAMSDFSALLPWILGLFSIVGLGIATVYVARIGPPEPETSDLADEFEIVDNIEKTL